MNFLLSFLIFLPIFCVFILCLFSKLESFLLKKVALFFSGLSLLFSILLFLFFDNSYTKFQFLEFVDWLPIFNFNFFIGLDGISLFFVLLSNFLTFVCILNSWVSISKYETEFFICLLMMNSFLILVFSALDLLLFYVFFESVLIPMFFIIGTWGSRTRKIKAVLQFFIYTLFGSLFMLLGIFFIYFETGTTDYQLLINHNFSFEKQFFLWISFFLSFAVKVPMIPFHLWLPEAHVEAPTSGSIILAGILLKMGTYGFLRFSLPLFPDASFFFAPFIYVLSVVAIIFTSLTALRQIDLKKIIAYSSVAHMGFVTLGIFTFNLQGLEGSILIMISHGFVSSALFLSIGILYDRYHTRLLKYYSGMIQIMPIFGASFLFLSMANLGFPSTSSFCGEFLTILGIFQVNTISCFFSSFGMVLSASYSLWLANRILFGQCNIIYLKLFSDLNKREACLLFPLNLFILFLGIYPEIILDSLHLSISSLIETF